LTQSKEGAYYHDEIDEIFDLTANGFKMIKNGSKQSLIKMNLLYK